VDDEPFMRSTIRAVLRAVDRFVVAEAEDGDSALDAVLTFKPDVVLCDVAMPRVDGLAFVARLRQHQNMVVRGTPVVMLTGHAEEETVLGAFRLQISGFLVKPVSPKALGAKLRSILDGSRTMHSA
jgi:two-component system, chemotaxis family, chemotaxis protein CheY